jgi:hypothetical protein
MHQMAYRNRFVRLTCAYITCANASLELGLGIKRCTLTFLDYQPSSIMMSDPQSSDTLKEDAFEQWINQTLNPLLRSAQLEPVTDPRAVMVDGRNTSTVQFSEDYIASLVWSLKSKQPSDQVQKDIVQEGPSISFALCAYYIQNGSMDLDELASMGYVFSPSKHFWSGH